MTDIRTGFSESEMHFHETASTRPCDFPGTRLHGDPLARRWGRL